MSTKVILLLASAFFIALPFLIPHLFPLAWFSLVPLFCILYQVPLRHAFFFGWLSGVLANLLGFYWLPYTIRVFGGFPYIPSLLLFALFIALEALQFAFFSLVVRRLGLGPFYLFPALFWVAIEFWFPHLFPWHFAGSQTSFLTLIQSADLVGPYGTSFLLLWLNSIIYGAFRGSRRDRTLVVSAALLSSLIVAALFYGRLRVSQVAAELGAAPKVSLGAVQGNIDVEQKWDIENLKSNLKAHQDLTGKIHGANVVIWPETAVEAWFPDDLRELPEELFPPKADNAFFIFGVRSFDGDLGAPGFKAYNSAFLADPEGRIVSRYHKQALLAFGEYIPFSELLSKIPGFPPLVGFTAGEGPMTLDVSSTLRIAPLICYEDLIPRLARQFVLQKGAHLLVNLTNDAWYGRSVAPWQHARLGQWRAIETRRNLVRVTNTGVTAVVNAKGEMLEALPIFSPGVLEAEVEILRGETFYVRFGDWFAWLVSLAAAGIILRSFAPLLTRIANREA